MSWPGLTGDRKSNHNLKRAPRRGTQVSSRGYAVMATDSGKQKMVHKSINILFKT